MRHRMIRFLSAICAVALISALWTVSATAAEASASISVAPTTVEIGNEFSVTIKISSSGLAGADGVLAYDPSIIEFVSAPAEEARGTEGSVIISLETADLHNSTSVSTTIKFKAKSAGKATLSYTPTDTLREVDNSSNPYVSITCAAASTTVTVKAPQALSANADLASLMASSGTLSPAFSPNTTSYTVTVPNSVDHVYLNAKPQEAGAKQTDSGSGKDTLPVGTTTRVITVTAPNGATKKYTVKITRQPAEGETASQTPVSSESQTLPVQREVIVSVNGTTKTVVEDLTGVEIPAGFALDTQAINDDTVVCVRNAAGIPLLYLIDDESAGFYVYDSETISFTPLDTVSVGGADYLVLEKPRNTALPAGFTAAEVDVGERTLAGWQSESEKGFYLLYLCGPGTYKGFYRYDNMEGTLQRYVAASDKPANAPVAEVEKPLEGPAAFAAEYWLPLAICAGVLILGLTLALILAVTRKPAAPDADEPEEDGLPDDGERESEDFDLSTFSQPDDNSEK